MLCPGLISHPGCGDHASSNHDSICQDLQLLQDEEGVGGGCAVLRLKGPQARHHLHRGGAPARARPRDEGGRGCLACRQRHVLRGPLEVGQWVSR